MKTKKLFSGKGKEALKPEKDKLQPISLKAGPAVLRLIITNREGIEIARNEVNVVLKEEDHSPSSKISGIRLKLNKIQDNYKNLKEEIRSKVTLYIQSCINELD